ncbi:AraC family transcriptional regulator [Paenibacillus odorifer]|uniref:helix-turn-helix domain-containing protein n=1 Tax=Paenibacillus TaxID=44249 RepID=UPI00096F8ED8|nr:MULTISPECIES: helix-turn-helix domain-containing protein [Paenibacillus]MDH6426340.1 AraC-like DNA-binding protein [Paenibacillus sp. PastH-4]MDH6442363.1 AraC-like DNA-binding protein [Paenibacillus sp. PastF-4]MDH6526924.1 AraC-like DNA-binding protein [Paenibacillus sp. PastH-3]OMD69537.1 AraC family transcriptional regulator [Paenibacillus odorifer]
MRPLSFLSKLTIFAFVISTLPVIFIGSFSYFTSSNEIQKNVNNSKMELILQITSNVEHKLTTVNQTLNQVINSSVLKKALNNPLSETDFILYNDLRNEIRNMQSFDTKLEDVILLNQQQNWMIKNSGVYRLNEYKNHAQLSNLMNIADDTSWILNPSSLFYSEESINVTGCNYSISLIKKLPTNKLQKYGLALANIPVCSLQDFINSDVQPLDDIIVLDQAGRFLLHPDTSLIGKPKEQGGFKEVPLISDPSKQSGQFKTVINKKNYSVTFMRSQLNGWVYLSVTSMESLTKESNKIGMFTIIVCTFMLLFSILLAWIGSRRMYTPIERLLNQMGQRKPDIKSRHRNEFQIIGEQVHSLFQSKSQLEKEVRQHFQQVRTFFLINAFHGNVKKRDLLEELGQFGYQTQLVEWKTMAVITLSIDYAEDSSYEKKDLSLLLFAAHNMIEELICPEQRLAPVIMDHAVVVLLGSPDCDTQSFHKTLYSLTEKLQQEINNYLKVQVSIGLSLPFNAFDKLAIAYREGLEALKHRIKLGKGVIIQYENINSGKHYLNLNYPTHKENDLMDAIKLAETDKAKELIHLLFKSIFALELSPQEYQIPLTRLLNNLLIMMQESGISLNQIYHANGSIFEELHDLHTVAEIEDWFWSMVIYPMIKIFISRQNAQYQNISEKIIDLIQHEYDTDLTLEECASRLHYNANYISSVFRKETQYYFSEYLTMYRFKMAKKWLQETDMPIKDIAAKLRYNNSQNFIRSFRKQEGMTPGQYRDNNTGTKSKPTFDESM